MLFTEKWYRDGSENHAFRGIEMVEILNSTLSIPVQIFLKTPPPPGEVVIISKNVWNTMRHVVPGKCKSTNITCLKNENVSITEPKDVAYTLNSFFADMSTTGG